MYVDLLCRKCIRDDDDVLFDNISRLNNQCVGLGTRPTCVGLFTVISRMLVEY